VRQPVPFGKYLLLDRISVGGMAEVFKAKSYGVEGFEKIIAIKRILPTMGEDRDFIKMFIDEAKIAGQLAHANICQIFELGRIDGSHFIAMEYIWGKDLLQIQNRLRKIKQPMPIAMACFSIAKVLEGLDYAHRKRDPLGRPLEIVHRDCSPQNVLVSYEGEVKVIDFGIAKATSRNSRTMAGVLKGKFGYMSPEQVRGLPLDRRSDIFALGTMLYECLTSDRLFQGETDFSTLEKVRNVDIRPPREINPAIPPAVEAVIMKALAKDVEERYQWCSEMLADLQAFLMSQDVVFTAKSLSSWLKEVFAAEIDRERQQLEQYKRVGRDGLFAGVPAAEAKVDVVETLGEAGPVEGDPTVLGGPNFEDIEHAAGAAPEVGPAPGSPATRTASEVEDDSGEDFGEEAPTEIFGEIDHGANPAGPPGSRAPASPQPPLTRPPKPPPTSRAPTSRGEVSPPLVPLPGMAASAPTLVPGRTPPPSAGDPALGGAQPSALGTPGAMPVAPPTNGIPSNLAGNQGQGRTLIGATAPAGLPNYGAGYTPPPAPYPGQYPGQYPGPHPGQYPGPQGQAAPMPQLGHSLGHPGPGQTPMPQLLHPGGPQSSGQGGPMGGMPMGGPGMQGMQGMQGPPGMQGFGSAPYPQMQHPPYGASNQFSLPVPPLEQIQPDGKRRSSIARDVAIGVAIAAIVLGIFLAVKFLFLDAGGGSTEPVATTPAYAKVRPVLAVDAANLFVDDKKVGTVISRQDIDVTAGQHRIKLVGPSGTLCERELTLVAGKIFVLDCAPAAGSGSGAAGTGSADPAGSAAAGTGSAGSGSAGGSAATDPASAGSAGSGSARADASDHPAPDKTDRMPVEEPAKPGDKPADKPADRPTEHVADRPAAHPPEKQEKPERPERQDKLATRPADRPGSRPADHAARPAAADDELGSLQGGVKPGDKKPADARADTGKGYLTAVTRPVAQVFVDGNDTGLMTPILGHALALPPGKHKVVFVYAGGKTGYTVVLKAGDTQALNKELR
jgi:serine/threonine protein kinase